MDDDFDSGGGGFSPRFMFGVLGSFVIPLIAITVMTPVVLYAFARWRDAREPAPDPHLGAKFAVGFFKWQGFQLALLGLAVLLYSITTKSSGEAREQIYRPAFALLIPGLLVFGVASWVLSRTNERERPQVSRLLAGYHLMLTGLIGFAFLVLAFQVLFAKGDAGDPGRLIWSVTIVYVGAWIVQTTLFLGSIGVGPTSDTVDTPRPNPSPPLS